MSPCCQTRAISRNGSIMLIFPAENARGSNELRAAPGNAFSKKIGQDRLIRAIRFYAASSEDFGNASFLGRVPIREKGFSLAGFRDILPWISTPKLQSAGAKPRRSQPSSRKAGGLFISPSPLIQKIFNRRLRPSHGVTTGRITGRPSPFIHWGIAIFRQGGEIQTTALLLAVRVDWGVREPGAPGIRTGIEFRG